MIKLKQAINKKRYLNKRLLFVQISFGVMFLVVLVSLVKIQIIHPIKEGSNQYEKVEIPVPRGTIYDRNGNILAMSVPYYSLYIDSWKVNHHAKKDPSYPDRIKKELIAALKLNPATVEQKLQQRYPLIKKELSLEEYKALSEKKLIGTVYIPSISEYTRRNTRCHILGFAGTDGYVLREQNFIIMIFYRVKKASL